MGCARRAGSGHYLTEAEVERLRALQEWVAEPVILLAHSHTQAHTFATAHLRHAPGGTEPTRFTTCLTDEDEPRVRGLGPTIPVHILPGVSPEYDMPAVYATLRDRGHLIILHQSTPHPSPAAPW